MPPYALLYPYHFSLPYLAVSWLLLWISASTATTDATPERCLDRLMAMAMVTGAILLTEAH